MTKDLSADLIVGENVMSLVVEAFDPRLLGKATIRGLSQPLEIFEVCGAIEALVVLP